MGSLQEWDVSGTFDKKETLEIEERPLVPMLFPPGPDTTLVHLVLVAKVGKAIYHLVMTNIAMENPPIFNW